MNQFEREFVAHVKRWYKKHGRHTLPWRQTYDPYAILVSEIMLQQTQVDRVIPKYISFLMRFPTIAVLARAPLAEVLTFWQGLGYNRRAKYLHQCAKVVVDEYGGVFPLREAELRALPGVGPYTAGAVLAFAFNCGTPIIETNIRTVFIKHFFPRHTVPVTDTEILMLVERTLPKVRVRDWYYALMDYGSYLKRNGQGMNNKSMRYKKQSVFKGSNRQLRGAIIRLLVNEKMCSGKYLHSQLPQFSSQTIDGQLESLFNDGLLVKVSDKYRLAI